jgi:hypothetical protein
VDVPVSRYVSNTHTYLSNSHCSTTGMKKSKRVSGMLNTNAVVLRVQP